METNKFSGMQVYSTNFDVAVHWLNNSYIRCNEIPSLDRTIFENAHFNWDRVGDIYQWYLTSCSDSDVEFLEDHFAGLFFTYSEKLGLWVLAVNHWGTSWDYVHVFTDMKMAECELGESR